MHSGDIKHEALTRYTSHSASSRVINLGWGFWNEGPPVRGSGWGFGIYIYFWVRRTTVVYINLCRRVFLGHAVGLGVQVFQDPVSCSDGHTYERAAIERWLLHHDTSPMTREEIFEEDLIPNFALRKSIAEWRERQQQQQRQSEIPFSELKLGLGRLGYFPRASRVSSTAAVVSSAFEFAPVQKHSLLVVCSSSATYGDKPPAAWLLGQSECGLGPVSAAPGRTRRWRRRSGVVNTWQSRR